MDAVADMRFFSNDAKSPNFTVERRTAMAHGRWAVLTICCLLCSATGLIAGSSGCVLPKGLYQKWRQPEGDHSRAERYYYAFAYSLAEASLRRDEETFQQCLNLARADPFAALVAALVEYLHNGRRQSSAFIASLPKTRSNLQTFGIWTTL